MCVFSLAEGYCKRKEEDGDREERKYANRG